MKNDFWNAPVNIFAETDGAEAKPTPDPQEPMVEPRKFKIGNDKDRSEMWQLIKLKAMNDHKEELSYHTQSPLQRESNVVVDENGRAGAKESIMRGTKATGRHQAEFMKALRAEIYTNHGIDK